MQSLCVLTPYPHAELLARGGARGALPDAVSRGTEPALARAGRTVASAWFSRNMLRRPGAKWGHGGVDANSMSDFHNPDGTMKPAREILENQ